MEHPSSASFTRPKHVDIELVSVAYRNRSFPVHMHDQYVVGVVESGGETLTIDGTSYEVGEGDMITIDAGTAHANATLGDATLRYRVFYIRADVARSYVGRSDLRFPAPVRCDPACAQRLLELHRWFEAGTGDRLEEDTEFHARARSQSACLPHPVAHPCGQGNGAGGCATGRCRIRSGFCGPEPFHAPVPEHGRNLARPLS